MNNQDNANGEKSTERAEEEQKHILVQVALRLFHEQGYGMVKYAQIAKAAGITQKDAQDCFSSKQEICHQVIEAHLKNQKAQFEDINLNSNPRQRLSLYLDSMVENSESLIAFGCPMTDLYFDMKREDKPLADHAAEILKEKLAWIKEQFVLITRVENNMDLPERLDSAIHGISIQAQFTQSPRLIQHQVNQLKSWIRSM